MTATLAPVPVFRALDANGAPLAGGKLWTYAAGTTTPLATYTDSTGGTPNTNPVILDANGQAAVWLGASSYKFNLLSSADVAQPGWPVDNIRSDYGAAVADSAAALANTSDAAKGDALIGVKRVDLTNAIATTQHLVNAAQPVDLAAHYTITTGTATAGQRTTNTASINQALIDAKAAKVSIRLPAGRVEFSGTINAQNGVNVFGHGNMGEGSSSYIGSTLAYYGAGGVALNMKGTSSSVDTRIQCRWSDFVLDGANATGDAIGVQVGWNQRAMPLLSNVTIQSFNHYGLDFEDQNWNVSFDNLRVDTCGRSTANSAGIYKLPAIDSGTFNSISFNGLQVEGCGGTGSASGGIYMASTTTGNRGLYFTDCVIEGNTGSNEIYITNTADVEFVNLYVERSTALVNVNAVELAGCSASFRGGYIAGESKTHDMSGASGQKILTFSGGAGTDGVVGQYVIGTGIAPGSKIASVQAGVGFTLDTNTTGTLSATSCRYGFPLYAIKATTSSTVQIDGTSITSWLGAMAYNSASTVFTKNVQPGTVNVVGYAGDATAQWIGDYTPRFSVEKGGTNQTGIVDTTFTKLTWPTTLFDVTTAVASDKFTPQTLGRYQINAAAFFTGIPDWSQLLIAIYKNGVAFKVNGRQTSSSGVANTSVDISTVVDVTATTDYFEVYVRCVAPGAPATTVSGSAGYTRFEAFRVQ